MPTGAIDPPPSIFLEVITVGDLELLKLRLLRVHAYRCQISEWGMLCQRPAANIGQQPGAGWTPVCRDHLDHGVGYL